MPRRQPLKQRLESEWVELLCDAAGLPKERLPLLWDADFLPGADEQGFVLCEINVSSVAPFPPSAIGPIVQAVRSRLPA